MFAFPDWGATRGKWKRHAQDTVFTITASPSDVGSLCSTASGQKLKPLTQKEKRVKIKLQGNLTSYISKNLFLMHLSFQRVFVWRHAFSLIFSFSLKLPKVPFSSTGTPNNLPKSSASTVEILRNFRGEDGDLTFFRMENSFLHQMKSDPKAPRGVLVPCVKHPGNWPVRNFLKKLKDLSKFHSPNRMRTLVHFTSVRFRGISRLPEVLSPAFLQICWEVPTRQLHILSNSPIHESQLKVACFPESFRSFRAKNLKPPFLVTSRLSQGFSRFVASASSNGIELEMMPENITCSSQKDWKSSTPGRFGRIRPMWLRPSQQRSIWDVSK